MHVYLVFGTLLTLFGGAPLPGLSLPLLSSVIDSLSTLWCNCISQHRIYGVFGAQTHRRRPRAGYTFPVNICSRIHIQVPFQGLRISSPWLWAYFLGYFEVYLHVLRGVLNMSLSMQAFDESIHVYTKIHQK